MSSEATVAIRFAVRDAEVVRQALERMGKDGETALKKLDTAGQAPSKSLNLVSSVVNDLRGRATGLAVGLGPVGAGLISVGPAGLLAAAGIGALAAGLGRVQEGAKAFGQYAMMMRDLSEQTGFTTPQVQTLIDLLLRHGVAADKSATGLNHLSAEFANAQRGAGELYAELRRIDPALAEQFASARSLGDALNVLAVAESKTDTATASLLNKFAFGRGGAGFGPALLEMAGKGGLGAITDAAVKAGTAIDGGIIERQAAAATESERRARIVEQNWNEAFANIYNKWKDFKNLIGIGPDGEIKISLIVKQATEALFVDITKLPTASIERELANAKQQLSQVADRLANRSAKLPSPDDENYLGEQLFRSTSRPRRQATQDDEKQKKALQERIDLYQQELAFRSKSRDMSLQEGETPAGAINPDRDEEARKRLTRIVENERLRLGLLGDVAKAQEKIEAQNNEIDLKRRNGAAVSDSEAANIKAGQALQVTAGEISIRTRLGVATATERLIQTENELNHLRDIGKISEAQRTDALMLYRKELEATLRTEETRRSNLPGVTGLAREFGDVGKQIDQGLTTSLGNLNTSLVDIETGAKKGSDAIKDMGTQFARTAFGIVNQIFVVQPLAAALRNSLGGISFPGAFQLAPPLPIGPGGAGASSEGTIGGTGLPGFGGRYASGGTLPPGKWGIAGEHGPEPIFSGNAPLIVVPNSGMIDPRSASGSPAGGAPVVNVEVHNYHSGADVQTKQRSDGTLEVHINDMINRAVAGGIGSPRGLVAQALTARDSGRNLRG